MLHFYLSHFPILLTLLCIISAVGAINHCRVQQKIRTVNYTMSGSDNDLWPNGIVFYEIHESVSDSDEEMIFQAMQDVMSKTCIRFQRRRGNSNRGFVWIMRDNNECGSADMCYNSGKATVAKYGSNCRDVNTIVHELGHTLCLGHEHERSDRDKYLQYSSCNNKPDIDSTYDISGTLYDYGSQMHYSCNCQTGGGIPIMSGVSKCGDDVTEGLSVLDADRLNFLYNCGGCHSHRWIHKRLLTSEDKEHLIQFGETETGQPLYACRGYIGGSIVVGKYNDAKGKCFMAHKGRTRTLKWEYQVFTDSNWNWDKNQRARNGERGFYHFVPISPHNATISSKSLKRSISSDYVPAARRSDGVVGYLAWAKVSYQGKSEKSVGTVWNDDPNKMYFSFGGEAFETGSFQVFACS